MGQLGDELNNFNLQEDIGAEGTIKEEATTEVVMIEAAIKEEITGATTMIEITRAETVVTVVTSLEAMPTLA